MLVVGLDPSTVNTGLSLWDTERNKIVFATNIKGHKNVDWIGNAYYMSQEISDICVKYKMISDIILESIYVGINAQTTIKLGYLHGMIIMNLLKLNPSANIWSIRMVSIKSLLGISDKDGIIRYPQMWAGPISRKFGGIPSAKPAKASAHNYIFDNKIWGSPVDDNAADAILMAYSYGSTKSKKKFASLRIGE